MVNGNTLPNLIIGMNIADLDVGVHKDLTLTERMLMQFRFEGFRVLNRTNLTAQAPNHFLNTPMGGEITQECGHASKIQRTVGVQVFRSSASGGHVRPVAMSG